MLLLADTHVHLYDAYDLDACFTFAFDNFRRIERGCGPAGASGAIKLLCLAERRDCRMFERLREGGKGVPLSRHRVEPGAELAAVVVRNAADETLHLVAGRQVATRERLEVLALGGDVGVPDGKDILETIGRVRDEGALPVLAWAVGKWTGRRAEVVRSVLGVESPATLYIGDSSMRPNGWPRPRLMREAAARGFAIVAGSDPLPFPGQEALVASYGICASGDFDERAPVAGFRQLLTTGRPQFSFAGRRDSIASVAARLLRLRLAT